jgi:hypothetical protein
LGIFRKNSGYKNVYLNNRKNSNIQGSPFISDDWEYGTLCLAKDSLIVSNSNLKLKFNVYSNEIWMIYFKDTSILSSNEIHWFELKGENTKNRFEKYQKINPAKPHYFYRTILKNDNFVLFQDAKKDIKVADLVDRGMYTSGTPYDRFENKNQYYLSIGKNEYTKVKLTSKDIAKNLPMSYVEKWKRLVKKSKYSNKFTEDQVSKLLTNLFSKS